MKSVTSSLSHVNLKLLQTFLMVGEYSSFRIAAEKSFRSQSAVSAQIRQLEDQLGVPLFHRTTRSVRLTEEGQQLLDCAQRALLEVEQGLRKIRESADIRKGKVSMACSPTIAETRLARALAAFESVRRREVDFGVGPQIETSEFQFESLMDDPFYALVPKRLLDTDKDTVALSSLAEMPLLVLNQATAMRNMIEETMKEKRLRFSLRYEFTQAQTLISMASTGLGAAILPGVALPARIDASMHALRIVNPSMSRRVAVITARGHALSPASLRLVELLKQLIPLPADQKPQRSSVRKRSKVVYQG